MTDTRKAQLAVEADTSRAETGLDRLVKKGGEVGRAVADGGKQAAAGLDAIPKAAEGAAAGFDRAEGRLRASIQRATRDLQLLGATTSQRFAADIEFLGLDAKKFEPYLAELRAIEAQQRAVNSSLGTMGQSAKATAAALRQVPAQFTDIVVSLQGGQNPLTVFLQQGGQLKDVFGGAGAAAKALGGYVLGLVNPFTVAAAAAAGFALVYTKGAAEREGYVRTLVLTGNAIGATADQMASAAAAAAALGGTQGRAAEVITQIAASSRVGADNLQRFTAAAIALERAGGPAAEETAKAFADLGKEPYQAAIKLNEATNFLSASTLRQIKALDDAGRSSDAAKVAQEAYASALQQRTPELEKNLGTIQKGWRGITDTAKGAWDAMLGVGRSTTLQDQIAELEKSRDKLRGAAKNQELGGFRQFVRAATGERSYSDQADDLDKVIARLRESVKLSDDVAKAQERGAKQAAATGEFEKIVEQSLTKEQRLAAEILRIRTIGTAAGRDEAEIQRQITAAKERAAGSGSDQSEAAGLRARIVETRAYLQALGQLGLKAQELNEGEKTAQTLREQLKGTLDASTRAAKQSALAEAERLGALLRTVDAEEKRLKGVKAAQDEYDKLTQRTGQEADAISQLADAQAAANAVYGKGKTAIEELNLAQMRRLETDLEGTDNVDPKFLANLREKIAAQERYVTSLKKADFTDLNRGAEEWLRNATEAARLQAEEGTQAALTASAREKLAGTRAVELKLAKEIAEVNKSGLSDEEKKLTIAKLRAAAAKDIETVDTKASQTALREINDFLDPGRAESFGEALRTAFAGAGNSLVALSSALSDYARQQKEIEKQQKNVDLIDDGEERMRAQMRLSERAAQNQIGLYANLTGAAKGFFAEGSRGYKGLQAAETAFRLVQLASNLEMGFSAAALGVATQAAGDPYTAVPRMAAMAAIMASLGFAIGFSGGGSSSGGDGRKQATGTGTVLGDASAKSESISRSIDQLSSTAKLQLSTQSGMLASLRNIESNIGGLSGLILRSGANGDIASQFNVQTGTKLPGYITNPLSAGVLGGAIGLAVSAASRIPVLDKIIGALFGSKTKITGQGLSADAQSLSSILGTGGLSLQDYIDVNVKKKFFGITYSNKSSTQYSAADPVLQQQFSQVFRDFYSTISAAAGPLGLSLDQVSSRLDSFVVDIGKIDLSGLDGTKLQEKLAAVLGAEADQIATAAIPGLNAFQKVGEGYFETVVRVASGVEQARASLELLGLQAVGFAELTQKQGDVAAEIVRQTIAKVETSGTSPKLSAVGQMISTLDGSADELASTYRELVGVRDILVSLGQSGEALTPTLIGGAGGLDKLQSSLQSYQQNFLSDAERAQIALSQVAQSFRGLGFDTVPKSTAEFKQLLTGIDTTTEAGQKLWAQVLNLSGSFAEAQQLAEKAGLAVVAAASRLPDILKSQAATRAGLEVDLLTAKGDTTGAAALKRAQELAELTAGLSEAESAAAVAGYDYLASLRQQITGYNDARTAAQAASVAEQQRIDAIANQRQSLEDRLLQATGDTAAIRQRELAALDASNRSILERIFALEDEKTAAEAAAQATASEAERLRAIAEQAGGLQNQIDQLLGNTAAIRARELAALDPANRALQQRIYDIQDEQAAQQAAAQAQEEATREAQRAQEAANRAAEEAARAAEQLKKAWQGVTDTIFDEVSRLRSLISGGGSPQSYAAAQSAFAIGIAQAKAGDQEAARNLPALSQALLAIAEKQVVDYNELQRLRARLAAQLDAVGTQLSLQYGLQIPRLATGTNLVPRDMLAVIHKGEAVVPAPFNPANVGGISGADVVQAINDLREEQKSQALAMVTVQREMAKVLKAWNADGLPHERRETT